MAPAKTANIAAAPTTFELIAVHNFASGDIAVPLLAAWLIAEATKILGNSAGVALAAHSENVAANAALVVVSPRFSRIARSFSRERSTLIRAAFCVVPSASPTAAKSNDSK